MLKSRSTRPPGGWSFTQPQTGWLLPPGLAFNQAVDAIISHRKKNPRFQLPTDYDTVANELDAYTCQILKNSLNWCLGTSPPGSSFMVPPLAYRQLEGRKKAGSLRENVVAANKTANELESERKSWISWFGTGGLIANQIAEKRASICVRCPKNKYEDLRSKFGTSVSMSILELLTKLNDLGKFTPFDDFLNVCTIFFCPIRPIVWRPDETVKSNLNEKTISALPKHCWLLKCT